MRLLAACGDLCAPETAVPANRPSWCLFCKECCLDLAYHACLSPVEWPTHATYLERLMVHTQVVRCEYVCSRTACPCLLCYIVGQVSGEMAKPTLEDVPYHARLICAGRSHIEIVIAHATTATFINLVQDLLQGLHGCVPAHHTAHTISNTCQPFVRSTHCYCVV